MRMTKKPFIFISTLLLFFAISIQVSALSREEYNNLVRAYPDEYTLFSNEQQITGNIMQNDNGITSVQMTSSNFGACGSLKIDSGGNFTFVVYDTTTVACVDIFHYTGRSATYSDRSSSSTIKFSVLENPFTAANYLAANDDANTITRDSNFDISRVQVNGNVSLNDTDNEGNDSIEGQYAIEFVFNDGETVNMGKYGSISYTETGAYTYTLFNDLTEIRSLDYNQSLTEEFTYKLMQGTTSVQANLNITILGRLVSDAADSFVEIEPNNRSGSGCDQNIGCIESLGVATELKLSAGESIDMRGHLQTTVDKDWFSIESSGNEIIHLELCPEGSNCYGEKAWVMYVFDGDKLTKNIEDAQINFFTYGETRGLLSNSQRINYRQEFYGEEIFYSNDYLTSNHLYLAYEFGVFNSSLIGVIDPCFGKTSSLDIGVGEAKTYFIAISTPLARDGGESTDFGDTTAMQTCDKGGSVMLLRPGPEASWSTTVFSGTSSTTTEHTEETLQEWIGVSPYSEDQYSIKVQRTGNAPVPTASENSTTFDLKSITLKVPNLKVGTKVYSTDFDLMSRSASSSSNLQFTLSDYTETGETLTANAGYATYNPATQLVRIPNYVHSDGSIYSLILAYHPATDQESYWFELISYEKVN